MKLILVRGLPGSGKTTYARGLSNYFHVEADMWFNKNGEYLFNPKEIGLAHDWCQKVAAIALERGENVVVSNTFTRLWELAPYIHMAKTLGAECSIVKMTGQYQNVHGCPEHAIEKMKSRWEDCEGETLWSF